MSAWVRSFLEGEASRERAAEQAAKRDVVSGTELTPAQVTEIHRQLRADFYERETRRAA